MTAGGARRKPLRQALGAAIALALAAAVLWVARPAAVWKLLHDVEPLRLLPAATAAAIALVFRGLRLTMLLPPGRFRLPTATLVAAAAQAAALFVPARLGELALPWLLRRTASWPLAAGIGTLVAAHTLDLAALGVWAGIAIAAIWGLSEPAALAVALLLLTPPLLLPATLAIVDRVATRALATRGRRGRRWTRRIRRVRRAIDEARSRPARLLAAAASSLAMWAALWALAYHLLVAMGQRWPPAHVVAGSAAASLSNLLPVNLIANVGTLEAGWTAAFIALGVESGLAAATGFASHLWALVFAAIYGAVAWAVLLVRYPSTAL